MNWIYTAVVLAVAGVVPIAVLTARVLVALRRLTRELERAGGRLGPAQARFEAVVGALGGQEG